MTTKECDTCLKTKKTDSVVSKSEFEIRKDNYRGVPKFRNTCKDCCNESRNKRRAAARLLKAKAAEAVVTETVIAPVPAQVVQQEVPQIETKMCIRCKCVKPVTGFTFEKKTNKRVAYCKPCIVLNHKDAKAIVQKNMEKEFIFKNELPFFGRGDIEEVKPCYTCKVDKPLDEYIFRKDSGKLESRCKDCLAKAQHDRYVHIRDNGRTANINDEDVTESECIHCHEVKLKDEFYIDYMTGRYTNRCRPCVREYINAFRRTPEQREHNAAYMRDRKQNDPMLMLIQRNRTRIRDALAKDGVAKSKKTKKLLGCTTEKFREHLEKHAYGNIDIKDGKTYHLDHHVPCSWFDFTKRKHIKSCFNYKNIYPLTPEDNLRKSNRIYLEYDTTQHPLVDVYVRKCNRI